MDKKELLKRWALAYTEPSLFYVPWKRHKSNYYEYITVQFETHEHTIENWQRDPVFAIYRADDTKYEHPIYCTALYDKDNNLIQEFDSLQLAAQFCGGNSSTISAVCRGKRKTHKNYIWRYLD